MTTDPTLLQESIADAVRQALSDGEALQCTRVWEAWLYKTMTDEDFTDASDGPLVEEVAAAVLPLIRAAQADAWDGCADVAGDEMGVGGVPHAVKLRRCNPYRADQIEKEN